MFVQSRAYAFICDDALEGKRVRVGPLLSLRCRNPFLVDSACRLLDGGRLFFTYMFEASRRGKKKGRTFSR